MMKHWRQPIMPLFASVPSETFVWQWLLRACFLLGFGTLPTKPSHKDHCHDCCTHPHIWNRKTLASYGGCCHCAHYTELDRVWAGERTSV